MQFDWGEAGLRFLGLGLATGSVVFAAHMLGRQDHQPDISGLEHFAIYARPSTVAAQRVARHADIDFSPVGSTVKQSSSFRLIDADGRTAKLQGPNGELQVSAGDQIPGVGRVIAIERVAQKWRLRTESGVIAQR